MIYFYLAHQHTGGGATVINELYSHLKKKDTQVTLLHDISDIKLIFKLLLLKKSTIIWSLSHESNPLILLISRIIGHTNIYINHGIWFWESRLVNEYFSNVSLRSLYRQKKHEALLLIKQSIACFNAQHIIHISFYAKEIFNNTVPLNFYTKKNQSVIYLGVDQSRFNTNITKQKARRIFSMPTDDQVLLMIGRADNRKNVQDALKIIYQLNINAKKPTLLYFAFATSKHSDYGYIKSLSEKIKEFNIGKYVHLLTGISDQDLPTLYRTADAFLMLSTHSEMFGLVILEALASGIPVFGYNACATPEIISYNQEFFLADTLQHKKLSALIQNYLHLSLKDQRKIQRKNFASIKNLTWSNSAAKLMDLVKNIETTK